MKRRSFAEFCLNLQLKINIVIMKRILLPFVILFSVIFLCASCLDDSNDTEFIFADDTAISGFSLGTLNRYLHTTSSTGEDSIYRVSVTGSNYKFYIDQIKHEIYNVDSLPVGTDNAHVICSITSKNSGVILIKDADSDTLRYYSETDSVDFTKTREISVYDMAGTGRRTYRVNVNVHQEYGDSLKWNLMCEDDALGGLKAMKAVENNGSIYVFGTDGLYTHAFRSSAADGRTWTPVTNNFNHVVPAKDYNNVAVKGGYIYMLSGGMLMRTADGGNWEQVYNGGEISRIVGAGTKKLYALDGKGGIMSSEDGTVWTPETMDGATDKLPDTDICFAMLPLKTNEQTERMVMVGSHAQKDGVADTAALVWSKMEEYAPNSDRHSWVFYENTEKKLLPRLENLVMEYYDGRLVAFGGNERDGGNIKAFGQMYVSRDNGLTWIPDTRFYFPDGFSSSEESFAFVKDKENFIWIICGTTGQVWRGRINRLGWKQDQTSFTE